MAGTTPHEDRPIRIALTGMGLRGVGMARLMTRLAGLFDVAALVDRIGARAELARDHLALDVPCFDDLPACLDAVDCEAVGVFTHDAEHEPPAVEALRRGLSVYCEKPMATTLDACERIADAAGASEGRFYMGHNMRMGPYWRTLHDVVTSGEIGAPLSIATGEYYYGGRTYFRRWNRLRAPGGGLWLTKCVHDFDALCWLAGEPVRVHAAGGRKLFTPKTGAAERCGDCALRWECDDYQPLPAEPGPEEAFLEHWSRLGEPDGYLPPDACLYRADTETIEYGAATVQFADGAIASHTLSVVTTPQHSGRWATVCGTRGALRGDPDTGKIHVSFRAAGKPPRTYDVSSLEVGMHGGADAAAVRGFYRTVRHGHPPAATAHEGKRAVRLALAARRSMDENRAVDLP